jgi:hypothetical protein
MVVAEAARPAAAVEQRCVAQPQESTRQSKHQAAAPAQAARESALYTGNLLCTRDSSVHAIGRQSYRRDNPVEGTVR